MFFYLLTGRYDKLKVLQDHLTKKGEYSRRFLNTIYTCNNNEKVKILSENGHSKLKTKSYSVLGFINRKITQK